jgi:uncharacterized RDD family membrane protein YckC
MTAEASRHAQASDFLEGRASRRRRLTITTPEGVALFLNLADFGERAAAFAIDLFFWMLATVVFYLFVVFVILGAAKLTDDVGVTIALSIMLFLGFLVRNLYFIHFELAWQGLTPGKRIVGIKVVDRRGGPLQPMAIVARNLTRELEAFIPLGLLMAPGTGATAWERLSLLAWMLLFSLLPLFNSQRLRAGDLIGGTAVIALPRRILLGDLTEAVSASYTFQERHLRAYGAFELQILEDLLRRPSTPDSQSLRREVRDKIRTKIGWTEPVADEATDSFLRNFYAAQREHLEREQLYGRFRENKTVGTATVS